MLGGVCFFGIAYLLFCLNTNAIDIEKYDIRTMPQNTLVKVTGNVEKLNEYDKWSEFYIEGVKIRSTEVKISRNANITVIGRVSLYNNESYIEAFKVIHDY